MYECTRRHFVELYERYGGPILVFDLIRQVEKRPRETVLGAALAEAITALQQQLRREGGLLPRQRRERGGGGGDMSGPQLPLLC